MFSTYGFDAAGTSGVVGSGFVVAGVGVAIGIDGVVGIVGWDFVCSSRPRWKRLFFCLSSGGAFLSLSSTDSCGIFVVSARGRKKGDDGCAAKG